MNSKERLLKFIEYLSIGQGAFEKKCGISNGYINNNKGNIGASILNRIHDAYPELNIEYVALGSGNMLKTHDSEPIRDANPLTDFQFMNIPFVSIPAQGGYGKGFGDVEYIESLPTMPVIVDKNYKGKYMVFEVEGDSMDNNTRNAICDGDKILCREVRRELWCSKLHINDWFFVIVMKNDGITVKQVLKHDLKCNKLILHPLNPIFEDFEVHMDDISEIYSVVKIIDRNTRM